MSPEFSEKNVVPGITSEIEIEIPPECVVVMYNDDYTTKKFVVETLVAVFEKNEIQAISLMEKIHAEGSAVVGVYTYDIAFTKMGIVTLSAAKSGFPLRVEVKEQ